MTEPIRTLVVGWYPAADDGIFGRFVADQAAALAGTGEVSPDVVSFEPFWLHGDATVRLSVAKAWPRDVRRAVASGRLFADPAANAPPGIRVGRLGAAAGRTPFAGSDNEASHRSAALSAALETLEGQGLRYDLVHAHVGYPDGAAVARTARRLGLPFVITEHATFLARLWADNRVRARYLDAATRAARVIAVSRVLADQIESEFASLRGRVLVIPNAVDIDAFPLINSEARDPDELLWVGYRREVKGIPTLLRAFVAVRAARPTTRLRLVGRSPTDEEEDAWLQLARDLGVADAVVFEGPADRAGVAAAMGRAALFVHPSRIETMGVVAVEALAAGLPVVATDSGGVTEVLGGAVGSLGAIVPRDDPAALADAILETLRRRSTFEPSALRAAVADRYGAGAVARTLVDVYREVIRERGRAPSRRGLEGSAGPAHGGRGLGAFDGRVIVVGFDRPFLDRVIGRFPDWALDGVRFVTAGAVLPGRAADLLESAMASSLASYLAAGPSVAVPRSPRAVSGAVRALARRLRARRRLRRQVLPRLEATLDAALASVEATQDSPALVVCLGGIDVFVARRAVRAGRAILAPGGARWMADARWETAESG